MNRREFLKWFGSAAASAFLPKPKGEVPEENRVPTELESKMRDFMDDLYAVPLDPVEFKPAMTPNYSWGSSWGVPEPLVNRVDLEMVHEFDADGWFERARILKDGEMHKIIIQWDTAWDGPLKIKMTCDGLIVGRLEGLIIERSPYEFYDQGTLTFDVQLREREEGWGRIVIFPHEQRPVDAWDDMIVIGDAGDKGAIPMITFEMPSSPWDLGEFVSYENWLKGRS